MKFLSSFHDPKTRRYTAYYSIVLVTATAVVMLITFQIIHQNILQNSLAFFEGFFSLFMLVRNETIGKNFLRHMLYLKSFIA
jgi:hypothetical protein